MCQHPRVGVPPQPSRKMRTNQDPGSKHWALQQAPRQGGVISGNLQQPHNRSGSTTSGKGRRPACRSPKDHPSPVKQSRADLLNNNGQSIAEKCTRLSPTKQVQQLVSASRAANINQSACSADKGTKILFSSPSGPTSYKSESAIAKQVAPLLAYAGAKFSDPPSPKVLPKPPVHWFCDEDNSPRNNCMEMTNVLKVMLKVHA